MDFRQTSQPSGRPSSPVAPTPPESSKKHPVSSDLNGNNSSWLRILNTVVLFGVAILVAAIAFSFTRGHNGEAKLVTTGKYQAVFLSNGQVYFGKIATINNDYVRLQNIYYLTQSTTTGTDGKSTTDGSYTLVKLGCQQIHDPTDQMLINRSQVTFWENLNDDGKVVTSIKSFIKQNPKGPDCTQVSNQTQATSNTTTQGTSTTPTTSTTKQ